MKVLWKSIACTFLFLAMTLNAASLEWNGKSSSAKWRTIVRMQREILKDSILFTSSKNDPCTFLVTGNADLKKFLFVEIRYRVPKKIAKGNRGLLYYKSVGDKGYSGNAIKLGKWIDDGAWHVKKVLLNSRNITDFANKWQKSKTIDELRFDPFDGTGAIEIAYIRFSDGKAAPAPKKVKKKVAFVPLKEFLEKTQKGRFAAFSGQYRVSSHKAFEGKYCMEQGDSSDRESAATAQVVLPVKPNRKYILKVWNYNTIPVGQVLFSCVQSRSATERKGTSYIDRAWTQVPCNMEKWTQCELPVETFHNTHGLIVCFHVFNRGVGKAWWDKVELVEVIDKNPAVTVNDYPLFSSFTDRKVKMGYQKPIPGTKQKKVHWKELDEKKIPLKLSFNSYMPKDGEARLQISRGNKVYYSVSRKLSQKQEYILPLAKLPEGRYKLQISGIRNGKTLCRLEKDLWRLRPLAEKKLPPVKRTYTLPGKEYVLVDGKPFYSVSYSHFPSMHIYPDVTTYKGVEEEIAYIKEVLHTNVLNVITMSGAPNYRRLPRKEYLQKAIDYYAKSYLKQLDFCKKHNLYGMVSLHMGTALAHKGKCDYELTRGVIERVKHHPAIYMYSYDEPEPRKISPAEIQKLYKVVKEADPNHIVCINLCAKGLFKSYGKCSDLASYDFYPFPHSDLNYWRIYNKSIKEANPGAPLRSYLQLFQFPQSRFPTHEEAYAAFMAGFIDGNYNLTVYAWFSHHCKTLTSHPHMQSTARVLSNYGKRLFDFLTRGKAKELKLKADSDILYKYYETDKEACLLAVNTSRKKSASITPSFPGRKIRDFFDPAWSYRSGKEILLAPYETLCLRIKK